MPRDRVGRAREGNTSDGHNGNQHLDCDIHGKPPILAEPFTAAAKPVGAALSIRDLKRAQFPVRNPTRPNPGPRCLQQWAAMLVRRGHTSVSSIMRSHKDDGRRRAISTAHALIMTLDEPLHRKWRWRAIRLRWASTPRCGTRAWLNVRGVQEGKRGSRHRR